MPRRRGHTCLQLRSLFLKNTSQLSKHPPHLPVLWSVGDEAAVLNNAVNKYRYANRPSTYTGVLKSAVPKELFQCRPCKRTHCRPCASRSVFSITFHANGSWKISDHFLFLALISVHRHTRKPTNNYHRVHLPTIPYATPSIPPKINQSIRHYTPP